MQAAVYTYVLAEACDKGLTTLGVYATQMLTQTNAYAIIMHAVRSICTCLYNVITCIQAYKYSSLFASLHALADGQDIPETSIMPTSCQQTTLKYLA